MSINDALEQSPSITETNRALELFTDRIPERRLFASYLNDPARYCRHLPSGFLEFC